MTSYKDQVPSRPVSGSFSRHASSSRPHSGSLSLSASNANHRVSRRKSVNASAANPVAIATALKEYGDASAIPSGQHRKSISSRKNAESQSVNARPSMHGYFSSDPDQDQDALEDNSGEDVPGTQSKMAIKERNRRASDGSHLLKGDKKQSSGDLKCESCGKAYKHSSCLTKHLWEHDPAWAITSKLLISKHQQVQLLEAASVLCTMNVDGPYDMDVMDATTSQADFSEQSSASPEFSSSSDLQDELDSAETTPPPMSEAAYPIPEIKRNSPTGQHFSRSYRSMPSSSYTESVISPGLPPQRLSGADLRPTTSGTDDTSLAAATAGLSFAGTPRTRATRLSSEIPPVPPLPLQYQSFQRSMDSTLSSVYDPLNLRPSTLTQQLSDERTHREDTHELQGEDEEMFKMEE